MAQEFAHSLTPHSKIHATVLVRGLTIDLTTDLISRVTTLPLGIPWRKEDKGDSQVAKRKFFLEGEEPTEDKNGVRRDSLPYPWSEVGYQLLQYIPCEGIYSFVYGYHFRILEELRYGVETPVHQRLSIPYFLLQSIIDSSNKVKEGNSQQLAHHGLIRILIEDALQNLRIPIAWLVFRDLLVEDNIKTLTYDVSPTISEEEVKQEEEDTEPDKDEMDEEESDIEEHDEEEEEEGEEKEDDDET